MSDNRKTIFVVDDNASSLVEVREILSAKYNVFTLNSGEQLFKLLGKVKPNLILLDLLMPKMNGYEVLSSLKKNKAHDDIPVIFLTGFGNEDAAIEGFSRGAVDYIVKPFSPLLLLKRVGLHIELKDRQTEQQRAEIAEESNKAKSRFLARMSHEIRTPISAVMGISELQLKKPDLPPSVAESFDKIHTSVGVLLGVVNKILNLSAIESGTVNVVSRKYETANLIKDIAQAQAANLNNKDVKFNIVVNKNTPAYLIGDTNHIEYIVNTLLSNAFRFTTSGVVELSVCSQEGKKSLANLIISVRDTGIGMTSEHLNTIYNDYTRFHKHEKRFLEGAGLGLLIAQSLAKMMDANIEWSSELGKGTTVTLRIPQVIAKSDILGAETAKKLQGIKLDADAILNPKILPKPNARVLVVDDTDINLYVAQEYLNLYSVKCETCESGYEAIEKIKQGNVYDIILMDLMMPGMTGTETMLALREMDYTHPIIAFSASITMGHGESYLADGFDDCLAKPLTANKLNTILSRYIKTPLASDS